MKIFIFLVDHELQKVWQTMIGHDVRDLHSFLPKCVQSVMKMCFVVIVMWRRKRARQQRPYGTSVWCFALHFTFNYNLSPGVQCYPKTCSTDFTNITKQGQNQTVQDIWGHVKGLSLHHYLLELTWCVCVCVCVWVLG